MTVHYHGTPISPETAFLKLAGRSFCVSFAQPQDLRRAHLHGEGVLLDNGAYSAWRRGLTIDWRAYVEWLAPWMRYATTWCVIPDVIGGGAEENDRLLAWWREYARPVVGWDDCAPVWHLDEPVERFRRLVHGYKRVCVGSTEGFGQVGVDDRWHERMREAFNAIYANPKNHPRCWLHMLRGMRLAGSDYPFASLDSTDVGRNYHRGGRTIEERADRWDVDQCPGSWEPQPEQRRLFVEREAP